MAVAVQASTALGSVLKIARRLNAEELKGPGQGDQTWTCGFGVVGVEFP